MRIQDTEDYRQYLSLLGVCSAGCQDRHCGLIDNGCGLPRDEEILCGESGTPVSTGRHAPE
jgi:hypothetical protein